MAWNVPAGSDDAFGHTSSHMETSTTERTDPVVQVASNLVPCRGCGNGVAPLDQYACSNCKLWPLCGGCVLKSHFETCNARVFKVVTMLKSRVPLLRPFLTHFGEPYIAIIQDIQNRLRSALLEFDLLFSSCTSDPVFSGLVKRMSDDVLRSYERCSRTKRLYEDLKAAIERMDQFGKTNDQLSIYDISAIIFFECGPERIDALMHRFDSLIEGQYRTQVETALKKLSGVNKLLWWSKKDVTTQDSAQPEADKKKITRSKSFHGESSK